MFLAVREIADAAVKRARTGSGPSFILADTYRWRDHCGPNYDNTLGYRTVAEFENWKERDPIEALQAKLTGLELSDDAAKGFADREISREISDAFAYAEAAPFPDPQDITKYIYAG